MSEKEQSKVELKPVISPEALKGFYSNNLQLTLQNEELILDFFNVNFRSRTAVLGSRVFLNPHHAKRLHEALGRLLAVRHQAGQQVKGSEYTSEIGFDTGK